MATVGDVLVAVYHAVQESAFEEFGTKRTVEGRKKFPASDKSDLAANTYAPTFGELGEDHWWAGLYPCHNERDIWVLRTRKVDHR